MSSDSELVPSPLPSPIFSRCSPARCTVARRCREFYLRRLERTATMQKRWSLCVSDSNVDQEEASQNGNNASDIRDEGVTSAGTQGSDEVANGPTDSVTQESPGHHHPLRKCRSSLDLAMDSLRKEISSLIAQDNDLFRQLLSLHDSIAELRERQRSCFSLCPDEGDEEDGEEDDEADDADREDSHSPSLESLSDPGDQETSPDSTLSSRSSLSATSPSHHHLHHHHHHSHHHHSRYQQRMGDGGKKRHRAATVGNNDSRPLVFVNKNEFCWRCRKVPPPYRRASSISSLYWLHEDMDSYDSGIHLQGSHSDSDHEIFV